MYALGQEEKPRIPESAGRPWVRSLLTQTFGFSDPTLEQHYTNSLRIGAMTFAEVQADVMTRARPAPPAAPPRAPARAPMPGPRARALAPAPGLPPGAPTGPAMAWWANVPAWAWWAGGAGVLGLLFLTTAAGGGRR